ncbi:hypothetical protein Poli38472_013674 [Pythium oligandrum]|uniref:Uncharacterized protein n=1 Tax=Pythium oligandrum TaxID=41045 RepID=A0A8K1CE57_PYTOL|nr:hypothetical protein Poli38472_013674 [Pythium oligandrum]|eukprot:TMW61211.1 hypothetical protein Poli38472_013674 [Pythium oligandrum]
MARSSRSSILLTTLVTLLYVSSCLAQDAPVTDAPVVTTAAPSATPVETTAPPPVETTAAPPVETPAPAPVETSTAPSVAPATTAPVPTTAAPGVTTTAPVTTTAESKAPTPSITTKAPSSTDEEAVVTPEDNVKSSQGTANTTDTSAAKKSKSGQNIGIVVGSVVGIAVFAGLFVYAMEQRQRRMALEKVETPRFLASVTEVGPSYQHPDQRYEGFTSPIGSNNQAARMYANKKPSSMPSLVSSPPDSPQVNVTLVQSMPQPQLGSTSIPVGTDDIETSQGSIDATASSGTTAMFFAQSVGENDATGDMRESEIPVDSSFNINIFDALAEPAAEDFREPLKERVDSMLPLERHDMSFRFKTFVNEGSQSIDIDLASLSSDGSSDEQDVVEAQPVSVSFAPRASELSDLNRFSVSSSLADLHDNGRYTELEEYDV